MMPHNDVDDEEISLCDFFKPLNLGLTSQVAGPVRKEVPFHRSSVQFADERQEKKLMLESILLFEPDASFCDASVIESVMEQDFQDSCSSFDSWEYAHGGNCMRPGLLIETESVNLADLEQQVREQQAKEQQPKVQPGSEPQEKEEDGGIPLEIFAAVEGTATTPMSAHKPKKLAASATTRYDNKVNLHRALEKSSPLRMLDENAKARRARQDEIRQRKAKELAAEKKKRLEEEQRWLQEGAKGEEVRRKKASFEAAKATREIPVRSKSTPNAAPIVRRRISTPEPFLPKKTDPKKQQSAAGPPLRRMHSLEENKTVNKAPPPLRRNNTAEAGSRHHRKLRDSFKSTTPPSPTNNKPRPPMRRVKTDDGVIRMRHKHSDNKPVPTTKAPKRTPRKSRILEDVSSSGERSAETAQRRRYREVEEAGKTYNKSSKSDGPLSSGQQNAQCMANKRYDELNALKGQSLVGAWNKRERLVVKLQAVVRGFVVRRAVRKTKEKINGLRKHLAAMERAKQLELAAIRDSPELKALRKEVAALAVTDKKLALELERKALHGDIASVKDHNERTRQSMNQLAQNNKEIAKATRDLEHRCIQLEERNVTLQTTQEQLLSKVCKLKREMKKAKSDISTAKHNTMMEKRVGRICQTTILNVRSHTKTVAATSNDAFLKKVHKRSQILDKVQKNNNQQRGGGNNLDAHQQALGACPVVLSR